MLEEFGARIEYSRPFMMQNCPMDAADFLSAEVTLNYMPTHSAETRICFTR